MASLPQTEPQIRTTVAATVTLMLLIIWLLMVGGVFSLVLILPAKKAIIDSTLYGLLGTVFGTESTLLTASVGYWVGSSSGSKASSDALVESNKASSSVMAALAGTGSGTGGAPAKVEVVNTLDTPVPTTTEIPAPATPTPFMEIPV